MSMSFFKKLSNGFTNFTKLSKCVGWRGALSCKLKVQYLRLAGKLGLRKLSSQDYAMLLHPKDLLYAIYCRFDNSDIAVFEQIFIEKEYSCLDDLQDVRFILDCGANVGYSAAYFLSKYPEAQIVVVEPDSENFAACRRNLAPYGSRVQYLQKAIWSRQANLKIVRDQFRGGGAWAVQVRECKPEEMPDTEAVDIGTILKMFGCTKVDILKMDIEASEVFVFAEGYEGWLDLVQNIAIELHDQQCEEVFMQAISNRSYKVSLSGELTVCKGI
jgi:FkbM family methyltransferase